MYQSPYLIKFNVMCHLVNIVAKKFQNMKIVLILGAGSTLDNAKSHNDYDNPPLDKHFFRRTSSFLVNNLKMDPKKRKKLLDRFECLKDYFQKRHHINICANSKDSLEKIASTLFKDVRTKAFPDSYLVFLAFLMILCDILGETTNEMGNDRENPLYRIIDSYLKEGVNPDNITIISFNYDIFAEKVLATIALHSQHYCQINSLDPDSVVYYLQNGYELDLQSSDITLPPRPIQGYFPRNPGMNKFGIKILKLHGSLNWYSLYPSKMSFALMYNKNRKLKVSGEKAIYSSLLKYRDPNGRVHKTLPIIVPPIKKKTQIFHSKILNLWPKAKKALINADEILIYGYSCPRSDKECQKLLKTAIYDNKKITAVSVINPDPDICDRYIELLNPKKILWYRYSYLFEDRDFLLRRYAAIEDLFGSRCLENV